MLARSKRLRTERDYSGVFRQSRLVRGETITVRVAQSQAASDRYGFIVSTKVSKRATVRNLIKRRLRSGARSIQLPPHSPIDVAVTAQAGSAHASYSVLAQELQKLISTALYASPSRRHH